MIQENMNEEIAGHTDPPKVIVRVAVYIWVVIGVLILVSLWFHMELPEEFHC